MVIDEGDIMRMDLARHRARITIIPQEYALFRGTLRHNLDPEGRYPDTHLVDAFRHSGTLDFLEQGGDSEPVSQIKRTGCLLGCLSWIDSR